MSSVNDIGKRVRHIIRSNNIDFVAILYTYHIWRVGPHCSSADTVLCNVGGVKSQPFLATAGKGY